MPRDFVYLIDVGDIRGMIKGDSQNQVLWWLQQQSKYKGRGLAVRRATIEEIDKHIQVYSRIPRIPQKDKDHFYQHVRRFNVRPKSNRREHRSSQAHRSAK